MLLHFIAAALQPAIEATCQPFCVDIFRKGIDLVLSLVSQLPAEFNKSTFELPEDILQLHAEAAEALKEVIALTTYCHENVVEKLFKHIQLPNTLRVLYQSTKPLILECKSLVFCLQHIILRLICFNSPST